ncbi:MAG TPA: hypothetical protein VFA09_04080 [Ktedonobacteraceae bacterium]|nr:hypothetical protein [Ktedonobacteraceae bacterium]
MTTTYREDVRGRTDQAQQQDGFGQKSFEDILPVLLTTMVARQREEVGIQHPLLLATLLSRRWEEGGIQHPLLLAALLSHRREEMGVGGIAPFLLMNVMKRSQQGENIVPFLVAHAIASRKEHEEIREIITPVIVAAVLCSQKGQ